MHEQGFKIHTVGKIEDLLGVGFERNPACFNPFDKLDEAGNVVLKKGIYIAEKVWHQGEWINNQDVLLNFHHEVGHMMDESFKSECLSGDSAFAKLFSKAWKGIDQNEPNAIILGGLKNDELRKNEVFADMWGHLKLAPSAENQYSQDMRRLFEPCLNYLRSKEGEWKELAMSRKKP